MKSHLSLAALEGRNTQPLDDLAVGGLSNTFNKQYFTILEFDYHIVCLGFFLNFTRKDVDTIKRANIFFSCNVDTLHRVCLLGSLNYRTHSFQ